MMPPFFLSPFFSATRSSRTSLSVTSREQKYSTKSATESTSQSCASSVRSPSLVPTKASLAARAAAADAASASGSMTATSTSKEPAGSILAPNLCLSSLRATPPY